MPLVVATFVESYRTSRSAGLIAMEDWQAVMEPQVKKVLARDGVTVHVACHPGETDRRADLYGWIAVERGYVAAEPEVANGRHGHRLVPCDVPLVLYVYVKSPFRKLGIARGLFGAAGIGARWNYACRTSVVTKLAAKMREAEWLHLVARFPKPRSSDDREQAGRVQDRRRRPGQGKRPEDDRRGR
jgi:hypothetical protein